MFKQVNSDTYKGTCPYCKAESFKYKEGERWMFLCYSCQRNVPFEKVEPLVEKPTQTIGVSINYSSILDFCTKVSDLPEDHMCKQYVKSRLIPERHYETLYYTDKMAELTLPTEYSLPNGSPKLVLPFFNEDGKLFGLQVRSLNGEEPRYLTLMYDKDEKKIFGLERIDHNKPIVVVEGPIDSLFVENALAMAGTDGNENKYRTNSIICLDNEPRNKQIVQRMAKYLDDGFSIVIWPERIKVKDINDMVLKGEDVNSIIHSNVFSGLSGKVKLNTWKKV